MPIAARLTKGRVPVLAWTDDLEPQARKQLENVASLPIVHGHVAAMPDVHAGIGATVGSVIPTKGAIIPAAVGVDIGCGMNAVRLTLTANDAEERPGCAVNLAWRDGAFVGATHPTACLSTLRGASYATSEVRLTEAGLTSWDRGFDAAGAQVWGAVVGPYQFVRRP